MSKKEEKLKKIDNKIDLSKRLGDTQELILELHKDVLKVSGVLAQTSEERRREDEKTEKKFEQKMYYEGLVMGLILGIFGNLFASYFVKMLEIFDIPPLGWSLVTTIGLFLTILLIWLFYIKIRKLSS